MISKVSSIRASIQSRKFAFLVALASLASIILFTSVQAQSADPQPPQQPVKLIFIHHSSGENWLKDEDGGLGRALAENNYFVSDTNYGWGPDYIGDRTDIINWPEWFLGENSPQILQILYNESAQLSNYTRTFADPGGENLIILFKSCFPNSNLEGNPDDPPRAGDSLTVGNAKYIYNQLLGYFGSRPDKLFTVITAPPVSDPTYAANARAFNNWLVFDWLKENRYEQGNVAVFDFYNVLTGEANHHWLRGGNIEHVQGNESNTTAYPSGDDHPSQAGNRKATEEFVPLLNAYYNFWRSGNMASTPIEQATIPYEPTAPASSASPPTEEVEGSASVSPAGTLIDDFEVSNPSDTSGWEVYWDEASESQISCTPAGGEAYGGGKALQVDFNIAANSWATCGLFYQAAQDWSAAQGIAFYLRASAPALILDIDLYTGSPDDRQTYVFTLETPANSVDGWAYIEIPWEYLTRAAWEADGGSALTDLTGVVGLGLGFNTFPDTPNSGKVWIDDLQRMGGGSPPEVQQPDVESPAAPESEEPAIESPAPIEVTPETKPRGGLCKSTILLPAAIGLAAWSLKRRQR